MIEVELISITPDAERVIEQAGRTAYLSFDRAKEGSQARFIRMLVKSGHHSVLEHAYASFRIRGGSRAFTHQLVRHRLCSFTQQSQRYVDEQSFSYTEPESISATEEAHTLFVDLMDRAKDAYSKLRQLGIRNEDARFVLPNAVQSEIVVTANFREWRHVIALRGRADAQWEIRRTIIEILKILKERAPTVFEDFEIDGGRQLVLHAGDAGERGKD